MSLTVKFWGTRGSIPTPGQGTRRYGGNTPCIEIRHGDTVFFCDAGTGIREAGRAMTQRGSPDGHMHLFFTHTHWDHIQGFPFFGPAYDPDTTLQIWDVGEAGGRVHRLLSSQMQEDFFPVAFNQLGARIVPRGLASGPQEIDGVIVDHLPQPHPGGCSAFSFQADGRKVVYLTDSELDLLLPDFESTVKDPVRPRELPASLVEFVRGADLLIGDGQYTDEAYLRHQGWGHPRAATTVNLAMQAEVSQLAVFHHDPMETDTMLEEKVDTVRARAEAVGSALVVDGARELHELTLDGSPPR